MTDYLALSQTISHSIAVITMLEKEECTTSVQRQIRWDNSTWRRDSCRNINIVVECWVAGDGKEGRGQDLSADRRSLTLHQPNGILEVHRTSMGWNECYTLMKGYVVFTG
jgi:hypothetical protein